MSYSKYKMLDYFVTSAGKRLAFRLATTTTIGLFVGNFVPQSILTYKYKEFVQYYREGLPKPVSETILKRVEKAMDILEVKPFERLVIEPFIVIGLDCFQAGSTHFRFDALLGIPSNYSYTSTTDIDKQDLRFRNELIKWNSEHGKLLAESIVLTEDEQIFAICRSILQLQTHKVLLNSIYPAATFLLTYAVGNYVNQRHNLFARPLSLRLVMYSILSFFGFGMWSFLKDYTQVLYDVRIDNRLSQLGPEFVDAGIRFYDKILKRNMALRELIGDSTYTVKGNENYFLRQKALPLTTRKAFFEEVQKSAKEKTNMSGEAAADQTFM